MPLFRKITHQHIAWAVGFQFVWNGSHYTVSRVVLLDQGQNTHIWTKQDVVFNPKSGGESNTFSGKKTKTRQCGSHYFKESFGKFTL